MMMNYHYFRYLFTRLIDQINWLISLQVSGQTFNIPSPSSCQKLILRMLVSLLYPFGFTLQQFTTTCINSEVMQDIDDYSSIELPISTGPKNCTSSIWVHLGYPPFRNLNAVSQPNSYANLKMKPPNIFPDRFLSCKCMSRVVFWVVQEIGTHFSFCFSISSIKECTMDDSSQVGADMRRFLLLSYFLTNCLFSPS